MLSKINKTIHFFHLTWIDRIKGEVLENAKEEAYIVLKGHKCKDFGEEEEFDRNGEVPDYILDALLLMLDNIGMEKYKLASFGYETIDDVPKKIDRKKVYVYYEKDWDI